MKEFETGAVRDTGGKGRMDLLPMCALLRVSKHIENALTHYPERNWEKGLPMHSMLDSALRHLVKYMDGQTDEDHLCAAASNLLMALWTEEKLPEMQDIPSRMAKITAHPDLNDELGIARKLKKYAGVVSELQTERPTCVYYREERNECWAIKERKKCICEGNPAHCTTLTSEGQ